MLELNNFIAVHTFIFMVQVQIHVAIIFIQACYKIDTDVFRHQVDETYHNMTLRQAIIVYIYTINTLDCVT